MEFLRASSTSASASSSVRPPIAAINSDLAKVVKDTYDIFIDSGGSPDAYLSSADINSFLNDSFIFNGTLDAIVNGTVLTHENIIDKNSTKLTNTNATDEDVAELVIMAVTSIVLGLMILITVIGNVFVIAAIILERNLQNVANYLVASLAVADLLVACLVMPLGAVYEISKGWILGPELCDIWTSCDVLCCTASILHLVAIAADRYWAVTNVDYIHSRTTGRVFMMIFFVWVTGVIVSLAPQFGWKDPEYLQRIEQQKCMVSQDLGYQVFATCSTFYVPLLVILVLYWKIYQTARKRIHRRRPKQIISANNNQVVAPIKAKSRLRFRLNTSKFATEKSATSTLGLVDGNSTITVNTMGDTTDDSSGEQKKGIDLAPANTISAFNNYSPPWREGPTSSSSDIILTVSQQVVGSTQQQQQQHLNGNKENQEKETTLDIVSNNKLTPASAATIVQNQLSAPASPLLHTNNHQTIETKLSEATAQHPLIQPPPPPQQPSAQPPPPNQINKISEQQNQHKQQASAKFVPTGGIANPQNKVKARKETLEAKRERKAAKTLAIITGAFVVCWLPFFLMALIMPLCGDTCTMNDKVAALFLWLGYFNSTLNPVIYTIFSPEFRQAFKRILFGTRRTGYYRGGKL